MPNTKSGQRPLTTHWRPFHKFEGYQTGRSQYQPCQTGFPRCRSGATTLTDFGRGQGARERTQRYLTLAVVADPRGIEP